MSEPDQSSGRDFFEQAGSGNMPVNSGTGDQHVHIYMRPDPPRPQPSAPPPRQGAAPAPPPVQPHWNPAQPWPYPVPSVTAPAKPNSMPDQILTGIHGAGRWLLLNRRWYFAICVLSFGLLAWVPFAIEARRLRNGRSIALLTMFSAAAVAVLLMVELVPKRDPAEDVTFVDAFPGFFVVTTMVLSCVFARMLRDERPAETAPARPTGPVAATVLESLVPQAEPAVAASPGPVPRTTTRRTSMAILVWILRVLLWLVTLAYFLVALVAVVATAQGEWKTTADTVLALACFVLPFLLFAAMAVWDVVRLARRGPATGT